MNILATFGAFVLGIIIAAAVLVLAGVLSFDIDIDVKRK